MLAMSQDEVLDELVNCRHRRVLGNGRERCVLDS